MALDLEQFVLNLERSGLIGPAPLGQIRAEVDAGSHRDPAGLVAALRSRGLLTSWQAEKLLAGVDRGFCLGKYKLLRLVSSGSMSSVYEAEHLLLHRRVALKVLPKSLVDDGSFLQRFYREAQAVARLDHPNIVRGFDVGQEGDHHYLVMEFVEGISLQELVESSGPRPPREAAELIRQAALGLEYAHRAGLVHRDIKPANLIRDLEGTVKILDLGLVRSLRQDDEEAGLTRAHGEAVLGTVDYLSPEQAIDSHEVDTRSDIYSLGCVLYFLLTGAPPFDRGTLAERLLAHQTQAPAPLTGPDSEIPEGLARIVARMLFKRPEGRQRTPGEVASDLEGWLRALDDSQAQQAPRIEPAGQLHGNEGRANPSRSGRRAGPVAPVAASPLSDSRRGRSAIAGTSESPDALPKIAGLEARSLEECWDRWAVVLESHGPKGQLLPKLDEASYRRIYQELRHACRASFADVDEASRLTLGRIEDLIAPWPTLPSLRAILRVGMGADLLLQAREIDRLLQRKAPPFLSLLSLAILIACCAAAIAWFYSYLFP